MPSNPRIFFTLFLAVFSTTMGVGLVAPLLPVYAHELGAGSFQIGMIFGAFSLSRTIFVPYFGKMSDLKGRKPFLTLGLFLYFVLSLCFAFTTEVPLFIFLRSGQGFASAMILPVAQAYAGLITPQKKEGLMMGLFNISLYGGLSLGPMLGGFVKDWFSIQVSFLSMGALTLFGFLLCLVLLPTEGGRKTAEAGSSKRAIPYLKLMREPSILALFSFRVCFTTGIGVLWAFLPLLATTKVHLTSSSIGVVVMINVLVSGLFHAPMGYLADRLNKRVLIIIGGVLGALSICLLTQGTTFTHLFLGSGLFGLAGGIAFPAIMALGVIEGRRLEAMGSVMGLLAQAHSVGMLAGPVLGGILLDFSSFTTVFISGTLTILGGTALLAVLYRPAYGREDRQQ